MTGENIIRKALDIKDKLVEDRRYLHKNPGIGFEINETYEYVKQRLVEMGYSPLACGRKGLIATVGNKGGKVFLIRADMDGLKIQEETDVEYKSLNGNMHGCGHDMHTAMLLGAAKILKEYEQDINGTIKLMFQPAEELLEGSKDMIEAGILKKPKVDAGLMIHVMTAVDLETGQVIVAPPGVSAPSADFFSINIQGKGAHGANPSDGVDPINIASHIIIALQEINARELGFGDKTTITIGQIISGDSHNAIPDTAMLRGSIRTFNENTRNFVKQRLEEIAKSVANTFRGSANIEFTSGCPVLVNDVELVSKAKEFIDELPGVEEVIVKEQEGSGASEDFSYISQQIDTVMIAIAAGSKKKGYNYGLHHPKAEFDEEALPIGSAIYAYIAMKWLESVD